MQKYRLVRPSKGNAGFKTQDAFNIQSYTQTPMKDEKERDERSGNTAVWRSNEKEATETEPASPFRKPN